MYETVAIGIGANLGERRATLVGAAHALRAIPHSRNFHFSSLYETRAVDCPEPLPFLNAALSFETSLKPRDLLDTLFEIEDRFGRRRSYRNMPRLLDLDLLLYGDRIIEDQGLLVPHPRLANRLFVLAPLLDCLDGALVHPVLGRTLAAMESERRAVEGEHAVQEIRPKEWADDAIGGQLKDI